MNQTLSFYNSATADMFLPALGNAYNTNVILQANADTCWTNQLFYKNNDLATLYFAKSVKSDWKFIVLRWRRITWN